MADIIGIYPGRFQPFGRHHHKAFLALKNNCRADNYFITTSNKTEPSESPFNFKEKCMFIEGFGIDSDSIVEERAPYRPEFIKKFNTNTSVVFLLGEKDADRFKWTKKDGSPAYYQPFNKTKEMAGYREHGYILTAPHVGVKASTGQDYSGTFLRNRLAQISKEGFFEDFGWFDEQCFSMVKRNFNLKKNS